MYSKGIYLTLNFSKIYTVERNEQKQQNRFYHHFYYAIERL